MSSNRNSLFRSRLLPAAILIWLSQLALGAQVTTGSLAGVVLDSQGGRIPGAQVVLTSETRATKSAPVVTDSLGNFVFPNLTADTYAVEVTLTGFRTLRKTGVTVSPGDRVAVGTLVLELGGTAEVIEVTAATAPIQAYSAERSYTVATQQVENLPVANRSFTALVELAPGVSGIQRLGGGGFNNVMMDGISAMDTGNGAPVLLMNTESIAEVRVLVSNYQAEYGRSSGLQITAVTKSGTNDFHGSLYTVERNSRWDENSQTNILNGDPKPVVKQRDWGYSIGGPVGKAGGSNKLFFFYAQEFTPREAGNDVMRFRLPTALERQGDFSKSLDQNGNPYPYIKDPLIAGTCSPSDTRACFADGGVLGRIPQNRFYTPGINVLKMFPLPNISEVPPGQAFNYEITRPVESGLAWQPAVRFDYQARPTLRMSGKYSGWMQRNQTNNGTIPGFNDSQGGSNHTYSWATSVNYTLNNTTFLEVNYGQSKNASSGCGSGSSGIGPTFCGAGAYPMSPYGDRAAAGLADLPLLFPDARVFDSRYYAYDDASAVGSTGFRDGRVLVPPTFEWGNRIGNPPPSIRFPGIFKSHSWDLSGSLTKVMGAHTVKTGFYVNHSLKVSPPSGTSPWLGTLSFANDANNPLDTSFGFANAALGVFSSYQQGSKYIAGDYVFFNTEGYIQDNWRVTPKLTLDYGVRLTHQGPEYDELKQGPNFLPDRWSLAEAPTLYVAGCANGVFPCTGTNRQAQNPITKEFLGPNSATAIGTIVPGTGNELNGLIMPGDGIADSGYTTPWLTLAPRFGVAYDITGRQNIVLRGGGGMFYDRPNGGNRLHVNPPNLNVTARYGLLQSLGVGGLTTQSAPAVVGFEYENPNATSVQWNGGVQMALPGRMVLSAEYVGQHSYNQISSDNVGAIDFGTAFLPEYQDKTLSPTTTGASAVAVDLMRPNRGYGGVNLTWHRAWRTYHSLQLAVNRSYGSSFQFGFNDTIGLYDRANTPPRLQHAADGSYTFRADQAEADELLGNMNPAAHTFKGNFVWQLPSIESSETAARALGWVVNNWQLSGVWTGRTGPAYFNTFTYTSNGQPINITGSPDYNGRVRVVGDAGGGCSSDVHRQFNAAAFQGPVQGSVGLESSNNYLHGCFLSVLDLAVQRRFLLPGGNAIQFRIDLYNAPNAKGITARNSNMTLANPSNPATITNLPYDANGNLIPARSLPRGGGFGVATAYQAPRAIQMQLRFIF